MKNIGGWLVILAVLAVVLFAIFVPYAFAAVLTVTIVGAALFAVWLASSWIASFIHEFRRLRREEHVRAEVNGKSRD